MDHEWVCGDGTCLRCCSVIVSGPFAAGLANAADLADSATTVGRRVRHTELQFLVDATTVQVAEQVNAVEQRGELAAWGALQCNEALQRLQWCQRQHDFADQWRMRAPEARDDVVLSGGEDVFAPSGARRCSTISWHH